MTTSDAARAAGRSWRPRVRRLTAGALGAAVLATGGITAILATGPDAAASQSTTAAAADAAANSAAGSGATSGSLTGPARTPTASSGRQHATSGGS